MPRFSPSARLAKGCGLGEERGRANLEPDGRVRWRPLREWLSRQVKDRHQTGKRSSLRGGVLLDEQSGGDHPVGTQIAQPTVGVSGMDPRLFDELLGAGFAVVGRSESDNKVGEKAALVMRGLDVRYVSLE